MKLKLASNIFVSTFLVMGAITFGIKEINSKDQKYLESKAATAIATYYQSVNGSGSTLLSSINTVISSQTDLGYGGLWTMYGTTDRRADGKIYDLYSDCTNFTYSSGQCGSYSNIGDCYNREHTIPKSWWGGAESAQGSDGFIVLPSDGKVNGMRSNYPYGETTSGTAYRLTNDPQGNRLGTSTSTQYVSGTVFEPFDNRKGDLARTYFYAVARYLNQKSGSNNLGAVYNWTSGDGSKVFGNGSGYNNYIKSSYANMLLKWHQEDPVSDWEIQRNNLVENAQGNRNPFIDHPSWVDIIWGGTYGSNQTNGEDTSAGEVTNGQLTPSAGITSISKTTANLTKGGNTTTISAVSSNSGTISWTTSNSNICSISSNSSASGSSITLTSGNTTGTATITASITISGTTYLKTCTVTVSEPKSLSSISISGQTTQLTVNSAFSFGGTVTANYSDSTSADVTSSATFSGYDMSTTGNYTVTVSYTEGGTTKTKTYTLTVSEASGDYEKVTSTSDITDGSYLIVYETGNVALNSALTSDQASNTINVTISNNKIQSNSTTDAASFTIKASNGTILGTGGSYIYHSGSSNSLNYTTTENSATNTLSISNGNFVAQCGTYYLRYNNSNGQYRFRYYSSSGSQQAIQLYKKSSSSGSTKTLSSISVDGYNDSFTVGDTFSFGGTVTAHYSDTTTADVTASATFSGYNMSNTGQQTVTVSYIEGGTTKTTTYNITVSAAKTLSSITISGYTTSFTEGDDFAFGGTVTANYSDSTSSNVTASSFFSGYNMTTVGQQTVTVTYSNKSTSYNITIGMATLDSITLSGQTTAYSVNDSFAFTGTCIAHFKNNSYSKNVTPTSVSSPNMSSSGEKTITVSFTYNGVTKTAQYTINVSSYTGPIANGRYYILNSTELYGLSGEYSSSSTPTVKAVATVECNAFDFTLVANNTYQISVTVNTSTYYLVANTTATSSSNNQVRVTNSFVSGLKSHDWYITQSGDDYELKQNTTGTTNRYLACYSDKGTPKDWRGYLNTSNGDPNIHLVAEGSKVASIVSSINNLTCNNGVTPPSTSSWSSIATAYGNISILSEKNYFKNTTANQLGTSIQQAAAKYDYIVGKYGTSSYSDFANRNPASLNSGAVLQVAQINDNMLITVISTLAIVSFVGFTYCLYIKKKRNRE